MKNYIFENTAFRVSTPKHSKDQNMNKCIIKKKYEGGHTS